MPRSFFSFYLESGLRGGPLLPCDFASEQARKQAVERASERRIAPALAAELARQDAALPPSAARRRAIEDLSRPGTVAVLTGQQVGLFLGPLYTLYKAATAIVLARALEREVGVRAVPVFWMATEDHDFAEIDHCTVSAPFFARLRVGSELARRRRCPVGDLLLGQDVTLAVDSVRLALEARPFGADVAALLAAHYKKEHSFAQAFAGLLASLFADDGLLVFDPRTPAVAALSLPAWQTALGRAPDICSRLSARNAELASAGFDAQVSVRDQSALVFHLSAAGEREVVSAADGARLAAAERDPMRLSSSALLRPIVQDTLFPTAAYVGGPAEVSYFAQTAALYPVFDLPLPLVAPRARFRLLDKRVRADLARLGIDAADVEAPRDALIRRLAEAHADPAPSQLRERLVGAALGELDALEPRFTALDPEMKRALRRTRGTVGRALERLLARYARAFARRDHDSAAALDRVRAALYPEEQPQERVYAFPSFAADIGARALVTGIIDALHPFDPNVRNLDLGLVS